MSGGRFLPLPERPCLVEFREEMRRPSGVLGPLEREPLSWEARCLGIGAGGHGCGSDAGGGEGWSPIASGERGKNIVGSGDWRGFGFEERNRGVDWEFGRVFWGLLVPSVRRPRGCCWATLLVVMSGQNERGLRDGRKVDLLPLVPSAPTQLGSCMGHPAAIFDSTRRSTRGNRRVREISRRSCGSQA